jgi:hypothetical protein
LSLSFLVAILASGVTQAQVAPLRPPEAVGEETRPHAKVRTPKLKRPDRADLREAWNAYWFGGKADPEYLKHKAKAAAEEAEKWSHLLPNGEDRPLAPGTLNTWSNLGPMADVNSASDPDIDSGRLTAIVAHPTNAQILYVATAGGGVFRCSNADLTASGDWTWTPITDNLPSSSSGGNVSVGAFALSPANPDILYLGAGDAFDAEAVGFFRSVNGGATWTAATGMRNQTRTLDLLALDANVVLVGTNDGLKRSADGGQTFTSVTLGTSSTGYVWSIARLSATDLVCSRQTSTGGTIWYSRDAGATWTQATLDSTVTALSPGRITLATSAASSTTGWGLTHSGYYVSRGLLRTTDRGQTWTFVAAPDVAGGLFRGRGRQDDLDQEGTHQDGGQGSYNQCLAVDPADVNRVFVGANLNLFATVNGGASWTQLTSWTASGHVYAHADFHTAAWSRTGAKALFIGNDGGLAILRDTTLASIPTGSFTSNYSVASNTAFLDNRRNKGLATHLIYSVGSTNAASPTDAQSRVTLGLQDNGTRVRQGSGTALQTSSTFEDKIGGDGFGTLIHPTNGNLMLGTLYNTVVLKSSDGGASDFSDSFSGITEAGTQNAPFATQLAQGSTADTVYTFVNTRVYRSANFGTSWTPMGMSGYSSSRTIRNVAASASNANAVAIVTTGNTGYITTNGGTSWTAFGAIPNAGGDEMSHVWFDTTNSSVLYAASVAPSATASHIWRSANGGSSWTAIDRNGSGGANGFPFGIPVHVVKNDPADSQVLFAGTDFGVYRSADAGATWARYGQGMPIVAVRDAYISPGTSFVRAGTFGRGVWELREAGLPTAPTITTQPLSQSVNAGQTATFTVAASGTAPFTYQWRKNGVAIAGATASGYTTPATVSGDSGSTYSVVLTNSVGSATSGNATLTVTTSLTFMEVEANNTIATANAVATTFTAIQGNLPAVSDIDNFALTLQPGQKITIAMTGPTGLDWDLFLKDSAGATLAKSETTTTTENLSWTNGATVKTVYPQVIVFNTSAGSATPYRLGLTYSAVVIDNIAPTVTASELGTAGPITLSANASDNVGGSGMARVEFLVDGVLKGTDTTSPYSMSLDSTTLLDGPHSLVARAYDVAGNSAPSTAVSFTIANVLNQNEVEANNTTATANTVATSGTTVTGFISASTDMDYFKVTLPAGRTLTATLTPPGTSDFDLYIYNTTSTTPIATSDQGTGLVDSASVTNTGTTAVTRYIQVKHWSGASTTQSYKLKLTF